MIGLPAGRPKVQLVLGDITEQDVDAIVNAANPTLMGGGGVDGAIHRAGGPSVLEECKAIRQAMGTALPTGKAVITGGGRLKARHIIHTVGPVSSGGKYGEPGFLRDAYRNSLAMAKEKGLISIAFPSISTGAYGYPVESAAKTAVEAVAGFLEVLGTGMEVIFVLHDAVTFSAYEKELRRAGGQGK
ncbi:MAG: O-acetyl-ADP-ribose deacetylase [Chloroflexi bacterium]|nr:O-acetyl-ADP-ribose deacetylase [Chloroflexota bacterium]